jgi:hypothetical protein
MLWAVGRVLRGARFCQNHSVDEHAPEIPSTIRVFVSSTFQDLHRERDALVRQAFPGLRDWCVARGMSLYEVDLRWGIPIEDSDPETVVATCLEEIDACRPFFVLLLGHRYGWVPPNMWRAELVHRFPVLAENAGKSVTELEGYRRARTGVRKSSPNGYKMISARASLRVGSGVDGHRSDLTSPTRARCSTASYLVPSCGSWNAR